jgi:hypothetical protein
MNAWIRRSQEKLAKKPAMALKTMIVLWSLLIIGLALWIDNPWVLAGLLAYEVLP